MQFLNMPCIDLTFEVENVDISKFDNFKHSLNIYFILVTNDVLKLFKFNDINFWHLLNILFILVTFHVIKLLKFIDVKLEHSENIFSILVTKDVLKFDKSKDSNELHL